MAKQEYVQLAHKLDLKKTSIGGWFVSEKLDGQRFFWDGGVSRGIPAKDVPYANTTKDARYVCEQIATGLYSRYGKAIQAPDWFLDKLPPFPIEGELWTGRNEFQRVSSIVRSSVNTSSADWRDVKALVFDAPPAEAFFAARKITPNPNVDFEIKQGSFEWWLERYEGPTRRTKANTGFRFRNLYLQQNLSLSKNVQYLPHVEINLDDPVGHLNSFTDDVLETGGEGSMLKSPGGLWLPERCRSILKYKPFSDAEGEVIGYTWGRATDRGSKLLGKIGAVIIRSKGVVFKLSGFTDEERSLHYLRDVDINALAGTELDPRDARSPHFPIGSTITYKYRELSDDGVPKEARYWRKHK